MTMFCYQCEQTAKGRGCTAGGVCGKDAETAALQDLLVHATKGLAMYAHRARQSGAIDREIDVFALEALFSTVTNVNFDPKRLADLLRKADKLRDRARRLCEAAAEAPEDTAWDNERERIVHQAISQLPETERKVLTLRFGTGREEPQTLTAIGKRLGFSAERASQLEQRALKKLAESPELAALREAA